MKLELPEIYPDELYTIDLSFHDGITGELLKNTRINHNITVLQNDHTLEQYSNEMTKDGTNSFDVMIPFEHTEMIQIIIELRAAVDEHGNATWYEEEIVFAVNVVPEFEIIAMILLLSLIPVILLSKSKILPKFQ